MTPQFFILGAERSGTTLLCALLSEHPQVCTANDTFMFKVYNDLVTPGASRVVLKGATRLLGSGRLISIAESSRLPPIHSSVTPRQVEEYRLGLTARYRRRQEGNWLGDYAERLAGATSNGFASLGALFEDTFRRLLPEDQRGKPILGEKTPIHSHQYRWLKRNYPSARFILLLRHPLTNVTAIYKRRPSGRAGLRRAMAVYDAYYAHSLRSGLNGADDRTLVIRYEDLINSPQQTLRNAFSFLEVESKDIETEFNYYIKQSYIGQGIDPGRDRELRELLDPSEQGAVLARHAWVVESFYREDPG